MNKDKNNNSNNDAKLCVENIEKTLENMKIDKNSGFKLVINAPCSLYNSIVYKTQTDVKVVYFGYGMENACDNMGIAMCIFFVNALRTPDKYNFMCFDEEPGEIQISVVNGKVYITNVDSINDRIEAARLQYDENLAVKYGNLVELNAYDCAKQCLDDIKQNMGLILSGLKDDSDDTINYKKYFNRYLETLKLLVKEYKSKLSSEEDFQLKQNLTIIEKYEKIEEKIKTFWQKSNTRLINNLNKEQREIYKELQKERDTIYKKF